MLKENVLVKKYIFLNEGKIDLNTTILYSFRIIIRPK